MQLSEKVQVTISLEEILEFIIDKYSNNKKMDIQNIARVKNLEKYFITKEVGTDKLEYITIVFRKEEINERFISKSKNSWQ